MLPTRYASPGLDYNLQHDLSFPYSNRLTVLLFQDLLEGTVE